MTPRAPLMFGKWVYLATKHPLTKALINIGLIGISWESTVLPWLSIPRLSETSIIRMQFRMWRLFKNGILTKIAESATEQRTCVCVSHVHVQCSRAVVRHCVQCEQESINMLMDSWCEV